MDDAGEVADFFAVVEKFVAGPGQGGEIVGEAQLAEFAGDAAEAVDAVDDFLADVAAFVEDDGVAFEAGFEGNDGLVQVGAVAGDGGFDAGGLEGGPAGGAAAEGFGGGDEFVGDGTKGGIGTEQVEAGGAQAGLVREVEVAEGGIGGGEDVAGIRGQGGEEGEGADDGGGLGALDAEEAVVGGGVDNLDVVGDEVFFEAGGDFGGEAGFEVEEEFLGEAVDVEVAFHLALQGGEGGVAALAGAEFFDVVGDLAVEVAGAVGTDEAKAGAAAEVEDGGALAKGGVLGEGVAVVGDGGAAADFGEDGAEALVKFV